MAFATRSVAEIYTCKLSGFCSAHAEQKIPQQVIFSYGRNGITPHQNSALSGQKWLILVEPGSINNQPTWAIYLRPITE
jgi:hypothetical protein